MTTTRRRRPARANHTKIASALADDLLVRRVAQLRANIAGHEIDGVRPQHYGMHRAQAEDRASLPFYEAELRRRRGAS